MQEIEVIATRKSGPSQMDKGQIDALDRHTPNIGRGIGESFAPNIQNAVDQEACVMGNDPPSRWCVRVFQEHGHVRQGY